LQSLERHHHFVVFDVIADQHQNLFAAMGRTPLGGMLGSIEGRPIRE
jgi:hypothetical protein